MKTREIMEKLKSGEITLDFAGHRMYCNLNYMLEQYQHYLDMSQGKGDGTWGEDVKDERMRNFYSAKLDFEVKDDEPLIIFDSVPCSNCAESLRWVLMGNKLQLRNHIVVEMNGFGGVRIHFENLPPEYVCEYSTPRPLTGEIQVQSPLVFANFFREFEDSPQEFKWADEWSLCNLKGQTKITKYKEEQNVAFGQMGNMSIGIYLHENKKSIIVGPHYNPAENGEFESEEEYEAICNKPLFEGYEKVGEICLDVWRWEATDWKTLTAIGVTEKGLQEEHEYRGFVELDVPHGTWKFEHYYESMYKDDMLIYSRFDLV